MGLQAVDAEAERLELGLHPAPMAEEHAIRILAALYFAQQLRALRRGERPVGDALPAIDGTRALHVHADLTESAEGDQQQVVAVRDAEPEWRTGRSTPQHRLAELTFHQAHARRRD